MATPLPLLCKNAIIQSQRSLRSGETWLKFAARYFSSKGSSKSDEDPLPSRGSHVGADMPNPVRNTEWEYFERIKSAEYQKYGPIYSQKAYQKGVTREFYSWLHWDLNIDDTEDLVARSKRRMWLRLVEDQKYNEQRQKVLGPDLASAHMIVARGGAVKFVGSNTWVAKDAEGKHQLPRGYVQNLHIEGIDVSNTQLTYIGFDTFEELEYLRFMKMDNCEFVDDTCMVKLQRLKGSLEFLDISNCPRVTDAGLTVLHKLSKLQGLRVSNLAGVKHLGLIALLLEEHLPELKILGLTDKDLEPPPWEHRGERKLVQALLGMDISKEGDDKEEVTEFLGKHSHDSLMTYSRRVRPVD